MNQNSGGREVPEGLLAPGEAVYPAEASALQPAVPQPHPPAHLPTCPPAPRCPRQCSLPHPAPVPTAGQEPWPQKEPDPSVGSVWNLCYTPAGCVTGPGGPFKETWQVDALGPRTRAPKVSRVTKGPGTPHGPEPTGVSNEVSLAPRAGAPWWAPPSRPGVWMHTVRDTTGHFSRHQGRHAAWAPLARWPLPGGDVSGRRTVLRSRGQRELSSLVVRVEPRPCLNTPTPAAGLQGLSWADLGLTVCPTDWELKPTWVEPKLAPPAIIPGTHAGQTPEEGLLGVCPCPPLPPTP